MATSDLINPDATADEHIFESALPFNPLPSTGACTLQEYVLKDVEKYSNRVALVDASDGRQYTYGQVKLLAKNVASSLANQFGIKKGDVVFVLLPNVAEYFIFVLGIISVGAVFSGSNPAAHASEIEKQVENSDAKLVITDAKAYDKITNLGLPVVVVDAGMVPNAVHVYTLQTLFEADGNEAPVVDILLDDVCALPYSSGTTGVSKGVMITHRNLIANLNQTLADSERMLAELEAGPADQEENVTLGLMPFFHIYGICGICCATMRMKGKVVAMARFTLEAFLEALLRFGITFAPVVPPIILQLVKSDLVDQLDLSKLKLKSVLTAAAPLGTDLQKAFEARFPGVEVQQAYGLTEYSCVTLSHCGSGHVRGNAKLGSVGFIVPGIQLKFVDSDSGSTLPANSPGEICIRGASAMKGYYKNEAATAATIDSQGWLHSGDVGYIDGDGDVFIVERFKELIKYKGFQVPPAELEAILVSHPSIEDAAVIPIPDEEAGEIPAACVVLTPETTLKAGEIMKFVATKVATYKQVRHVEFVTSIPKSSSGKILRRVLKDQVLKRLQQFPTNTTTHPSYKHETLGLVSTPANV